MSNSPGTYPRLFPSADQTIAGIGRTLREGRTSCVEILNGCFAQVDEWEPKVHAWVVLDREGAIEQARGLNDELKNGKDRGPLHGIPIGVKDIIDVAGLPTACGAKRWANRIAESDANVVASLREAGAVIMGKTVTTPYAWIDPPITRNPWNLERTPGGSSSGSAAAVACGMCYGAIGTQTGGSITRPASFCGVAGMKPDKITSDFNMSGIRPFSKSLDHVGPIARTVDDVRILFDVMPTRGFNESAPDSYASSERCPRLVRLRGFFDRRATADVLSAFDRAVRALKARGATVVEIDDPVDFDKILKDHRSVMAAEAAGVHSDAMDEFPDDYPPRIRELIQEGRSLQGPDQLPIKDRMNILLQGRSLDSLAYSGALKRMTLAEAALSSALCKHDGEFWITPATVSTAPEPSTTGDPAFNSAWSYTWLPTVSFPVGLAPDGLPVAIQIVGGIWRNKKLLAAAQWCEQAIRTTRH
jgi:Asp-tRNA(Asn)/Glu-tRNA(Gln) amidotransferase A subunit family amidase